MVETQMPPFAASYLCKMPIHRLRSQVDKCIGSSRECFGRSPTLHMDQPSHCIRQRLEKSPGCLLTESFNSVLQFSTAFWFVCVSKKKL